MKPTKPFSNQSNFKYYVDKIIFFRPKQIALKKFMFEYNGFFFSEISAIPVEFRK